MNLMGREKSPDMSKPLHITPQTKDLKKVNLSLTIPRSKGLGTNSQPSLRSDEVGDKENYDPSISTTAEISDVKNKAKKRSGVWANVNCEYEAVPIRPFQISPPSVPQRRGIPIVAFKKSRSNDENTASIMIPKVVIPDNIRPIRLLSFADESARDNLCIVDEVTLSPPDDRDENDHHISAVDMEIVPVEILPTIPILNAQHCRYRRFPFYRKGLLTLNEVVDDSVLPHTCRPFDLQCIFCKAWYSLDETNSEGKYTRCCDNGKIVIPPLGEVNEFFQSLLGGESRISKLFYKRPRHYNSNSSFGSIVMNHREFDTKSIPALSISGSVYHKLGSIDIEGIERKPCFMQTYFYEGANIGDLTKNTPQELELLGLIRNEIKKINTIYNGIRNPLSIHEQMFKGNVPERAFLVLKNEPLSVRNDPRTYALPSCQEVSCLNVVQVGELTSSRPIVINYDSGPLQIVNSFHSAYDPLCYSILHPFGEKGWTFHELQGPNSTKRLSARAFYAYRLHFRDAKDPTSPNTHVPIKSDILLRTRQLSHQYIVDMYAKVEESNLNWVQKNQKRLRADLYKNLVDAIATDDADNAGKKVILPSGFIGSPRYMHQLYLDALAIVRKMGKPSLFITMTANTKWDEIKTALLPGEDAFMRKDIVERVFEMKKNELLDDVLKKKIFGNVIAHMYSIEFQKRGLPHMHLLIILQQEDKISTADDCDKVVSAEIPDPIKNPILHNLVTKFNLHGPCGVDHPKSSCCDEGPCRFKFPQQYCSETQFDDNAYPNYRRRSPQNGGETYRKTEDGFVYSNAWVASYCPYLTLKFKCHINVEVVSSIKSVKYIYKYILKGPDMVTVGVRSGKEVNKGDEVTNFVEARYITPDYAIHRFFRFVLSGRSPAVERLPFHLPGEQRVLFQEGEVIAALEAPQKTKLEAYFDVVVAARQSNEQEIHCANSITYEEMPAYYTWTKFWKRRTHPKKSDMVGRLLYVPPTAGEKYYLRLLLMHQKGPESWEALKTVDGICHLTFKGACEALGLLSSDTEWENVMDEAVSFQVCSQLRKLFVTILIHNKPSNPLNLWNRFRESLAEDKTYERSVCLGLSRGEISIIDEDLDECLHDINDLIRDSTDGAETLNTYSLPLPHAPRRVLTPTNSLLRQELNYDTSIQQQLAEDAYASMNEQQRCVWEKVLTLLYQPPETRAHSAVFVDAPGGSGKTFTFKAILAKVRSNGDIAIAIAASAIAAILLPGGRTAHSRLKIPIPCNETTMCGFTRRNDLGKLLLQTKLLIWDEAMMQDRSCIECVDRSLQDLYGNTLLFGGILVVFGGDRRQLLPVVQRGSRAQIVNACISRSYLWEHICKMTLITNERVMRVSSNTEYCKYLLSIGEGSATPYQSIKDSVKLLPNLVCMSPKLDDFIKWVFPNPDNFDSSSAILSPWNDEVDTVNLLCLDRMMGTSIQLNSSDVLIDEKELFLYPVEFLNSLRPQGLPSHSIMLKLGCPIMLIRNLNPQKGLCNGTRLIVTYASKHLIKATIQNGTHIGDEAWIPRVRLSTSESSPAQFTRLQFPINLAFAITINKSQGQSLHRVGIYLPRPVFSHGALYVALSRCTDPLGISIYIIQDNDIQDGHSDNPHTKNIVYDEIIRIGFT